MTEKVLGSNYEQLHHFISESPWDAGAVMNVVATKVQSTFDSQLASRGVGVGVRGLIIDESGWEKSGKKSVGVARQYIGQVGKVANGQVGVFAALSNGEQVGLLQGRLYLPETWSSDRVRCEQAGIPKEEQVYRTKPALAVEILKTLPASISYDWVGGDCIYGNSFALRQYLYGQQQAFVLDVGETLGVYLETPQPYLPPKKEGRGRTPTQYICNQKPVLLKDILAQVKETDWQTLTHRTGTKGAMLRKAVLLDVYVWNAERENEVETLQLLISTEVDGSEIKYSLCYGGKEGKMSVETALFRQMQRYWVERAFQNCKEHLGMHQYQVRSWRAWYHHIALTLMALHFMLELQADVKDEAPLLSISDIKLIFAQKLANKMSTDEGLEEAIKIRHKQRKADIERYRKTPK
jgi:SRSO17 transposase